jgi:two-component system sensor histidine kinase ChvG
VNESSPIRRTELTSGDGPADTAAASPKRRFRLVSPLTRRVLAVNLVAPIILVGGLFYLDKYKNELIAADLESLRLRGEMVAAAIAEGAVIDNGLEVPNLSTHLAREMVRRLSPPAQVRTRLFAPGGELLSDSRGLISSQAPVQIESLPPPDRRWLATTFREVYDFITASGLGNQDLPLYHERMHPNAADYSEVGKALGGDSAWTVRRNGERRLILSAAVPVQHYKQVLGALMVTETGDDIAQSLFKVRLTIFQAFGIALGVTILLSLYLAGTIARPIRRLAAAAESVRRARGRRHTIPDLSRRGDEIGDLSGALREMTEALWRRMDAIEAFAADVSHEIKNPLTSLRSAVETAARVQNPDHQRKLMAIILDDVTRLDRLISDISDASRIDAEMSRVESEIVEMRPMIQTLADIYQQTGTNGGVEIEVRADPQDPLRVTGIESRLGQVLRNLLSNALSFSPPGGRIVVTATRGNGRVVVDIEDDGPGIPDNKLEAIFDRFYTERPSDEKFGTHSGLGLSISRQIVEAQGGTIRAANRMSADGRVAGARFTVTLPALGARPFAAESARGRGR